MMNVSLQKSSATRTFRRVREGHTVERVGGETEPGLFIPDLSPLGRAALFQTNEEWRREAERLQAQFRVLQKWGSPVLGQVIAFDRHQAASGDEP